MLTLNVRNVETGELVYSNYYKDDAKVVAFAADRAVTQADTVAGVTTVTALQPGHALTVQDGDGAHLVLLDATKYKVAFEFAPTPVPVISTKVLAPAQVGSAYSAAISASSGVGAFKYSGSNLPAGITVNAITGIISGTPTQAGDKAAVVAVTDSIGQKAEAELVISVKEAPVVVPPVEPVPTDKLAGLPTGWVPVLVDNFDTFECDTTGAKRWKYMDRKFGQPDRKIENVTKNAFVKDGWLYLCATRKDTPIGDIEFETGGIWTRGTSTQIPFEHYGCFDFESDDGQGIWPAAWLTATGGGSQCEIDPLEIFHVPEPNVARATVWQDPYNGYSKQVWNSSSKTLPNRLRYQEPGAAQTAHRCEWLVQLTGGTYAAPTAVTYTFWIDGKLLGTYTERTRLAWLKAYGGNVQKVFNILLNMQVCSSAGAHVCHPDDKLGFDRYGNTQLPTANVVRAGFDAAGTKLEAQKADLTDVSFRISSLRVWSPKAA